MAKLVAYICDHCDYEIEEIYNDTEEQEEDMGECPECQEGVLVKCNLKRNDQVWVQEL